LEDPNDPHTLIDRYDLGGGNHNNSSMELDARFKIIDGVALYNVSGSTWTDVTAALTTSGALTETAFYDKREEQNVTVYDIDISKFKTSGYFPPNASSTPPTTGPGYAARGYTMRPISVPR